MRQAADFLVMTHSWRTGACHLGAAFALLPPRRTLLPRTLGAAISPEDARVPAHEGHEQPGFSVGEIVVVLAIIGVVTTVTAPMMLSYWRAAALKGAAQELAAIANQARALSISRHTLVCMDQQSNRVRLLTGGCAGAAWVGAGTDANGWFSLDSGIAITTNPQVVFNPLGAATTAGTFTVHNPSDGNNMSVAVATTGRVTVSY